MHRLLLEVPSDKKIDFFIKKGPAPQQLKFNVNFDRCYGKDKSYREVFVEINDSLNKGNNELIFNYYCKYLGKINLKFDIFSE